jgi:hypothetical protein
MEQNEVMYHCTKSLTLISKGCIVTSVVCHVCSVILFQDMWCSTLHCLTQYTSHTPSGQGPLRHINRGSFLFKYTSQNINGCKLVLEEAYCHIVLMSQHCNFMLVNLCIVEF